MTLIPGLDNWQRPCQLTTALPPIVYWTADTLQWRHNECDDVSNHQPHDCLILNRLFRRRSRKHQSSASLAFVRGIHRWPVNSSQKRPVTRKMCAFDDVIMSVWDKRNFWSPGGPPLADHWVAQSVLSGPLRLCAVRIWQYSLFSMWSFDGKGFGSPNGPPWWIFRSPSRFIGRFRPPGDLLFYWLLGRNNIDLSMA